MSFISKSSIKKIKACFEEKTFDKNISEIMEKIETKEKDLLSYITDEYIRIITLCKSLENLKKPITELKTLNNNIESYFNELNTRIEYSVGDLNEIEQTLSNINNIKNILQKIISIIKISEEKNLGVFYTIKNINLLKENITYLYDSPFYSYFYDIYNNKKYTLIKETKKNVKEWCNNIFKNYERYGTMILDNMNNFEYKFGEEVGDILDETHYIMLNSIFKEGISKYYLIFDKKYFLRKEINFEIILQALYVFDKLKSKSEIAEIISKEQKNIILEELSKEDNISTSLLDNNSKSIKYLKICLGYEIVNFYLMDIYNGFECDKTITEKVIEKGVDKYFYVKIIDFKKYFKNSYKDIENRFKEEFYNHIIQQRSMFAENEYNFLEKIEEFMKESNKMLEQVKYKDLWDFYLKNLDDIFYEKIENGIEDEKDKEKIYEKLKKCIKKYHKYKFNSYMLIDRIFKNEIDNKANEYASKVEKILRKKDFGDNLEEIYKNLSLEIKNMNDGYKESVYKIFLTNLEVMIDKIEDEKQSEEKRVIFLKFKNTYFK
ncbi:hypothetical protein SLOPH_866 [Spraguea lophii 42_110]|uniref:Uncharacterized protein n=1 Tax=Spraguea lophii (strain 42_110) TaxID=1358809 RepID=S7XW34_SPRLO|nr:hypothetical protein SLOPH_866 [Spraguea lophii 42_110]